MQQFQLQETLGICMHIEVVNSNCNILTKTLFQIFRGIYEIRLRLESLNARYTAVSYSISKNSLYSILWLIKIKRLVAISSSFRSAFELTVL